MKQSDVNLRHFLALPDIAATGRLSAAAERAYLSQSALTQALRKLEHQAGMPLFDRLGYGVTTTNAGARLVNRAIRANELLEQVDREIRGRTPRHTRHTPMHRHFTTSHLRAMVAVVETGGYSSAARQLGLAQPTVYRAVRKLEEAIDVRLFVREARGIEPTESAKSLARYAGLVFAEIRQGFEDVGELAGRTDSKIAVGTLPLARSEFLPNAVIQLLRLYPDARVSIVDGPYDEQLHALRHGEIDWLIGALRDPLPATDIEQRPLFDQPLAVIVRPDHPLLKLETPSVRELAELDWIAPRPQTPAREQLSAFFERNGVPLPKRTIECGSLIATLGLLQQSDRAALLSPIQIRSYVTSGQLAILVESIPGTERAIGVTTRDNWEPTGVRAAFGQILGELAAELSARSA